MNDLFRSNIATGAAIALISCTIATAPAFTQIALADTDTYETVTSDTQECFDNRTYVAGLVGLTDQERIELAALLEKQDAYWNGMDENAGLTDSEVTRYNELIERADRCKLAQNLTADELSELDALNAKFEALKENEDLSEAEWERMFELENKGYGMVEDSEGVYEDLQPQTNAEYAAGLCGLTDAERAELVAILDKQDAYWAVYDAMAGLSDAEWGRIFELELKSSRAGIARNLTEAEYAEVKALWDKLDGLKEDEELTDAEWDRLIALEGKGYGYDEDGACPQDTLA